MYRFILTSCTQNGATRLAVLLLAVVHRTVKNAKTRHSIQIQIFYTEECREVNLFKISSKLCEHKFRPAAVNVIVTMRIVGLRLGVQRLSAELNLYRVWEIIYWKGAVWGSIPVT
jgi:hypothetical protein